MSFGYSSSDAVLLVQLAWNTVQNARKACGEYDELTQQVSALHVVLGRLQKEVSVEGGSHQRESLTRENQDTYNDEIQAIVSGCEKVLGTLDMILKKYNSLSERERGGRSKMLWKKVRFGNGEMADLGELRGKVVYHTSLLTLFLNLRSTGSVGRVEQQMNDAGGHLKEIKDIVNGIVAVQLCQSHPEGSILSAYTNDDRSVWKDIRRELRRRHGFQDADLGKHKTMIIDYISEIGDRGVFDERDLSEGKDEKENEECGDRATIQADLAANEHSKALQDPDDAQLTPNYILLSNTTSEDEPCDENQVVVDPRDKSLLKSFSALQEKFDEDYVPLCLGFLSAPPKDEESNIERHRLLSDGILTDILLNLAPIYCEINDSSDGPKARTINFSNRVQGWLAKLDEAAKENTTEWLVQLSDRLYNGLVVQFIDASVRQDSNEIKRKESYAVLRKKISQDLILLDDIEVNGSPGLKMVKAHIKGDLKAMRDAISKVRKTAKWEWKDQRSDATPALIPRVVLEIDQTGHEIVSREVDSIDLIRHSSLSYDPADKNIQELCISCRRPVEDLWLGISFSCNHDWCGACFCVMLEFCIKDPGSMPLECCGDGPTLAPVATTYNTTCQPSRSEVPHDANGCLPYRCQINTCGKIMEPRDCHWVPWPTRYRGYSQCSTCKAIHILINE